MSEKISKREQDDAFKELDNTEDEVGAVQMVMAAVDAYRTNPTEDNAKFAVELDEKVYDKFGSASWANWAVENGEDYDALDIYEDTLSQIRSEETIGMHLDGEAEELGIS